MLKILADECVHLDLIEALERDGFDILRVKDIEKGADDERVFELAKESKRALITFDRGFGDFFRFDIENSAGIVIVLIGKLMKEEIIRNTLTLLKSEVARDLRGKLVIIGKNKIRVRSFR